MQVLGIPLQDVVEGGIITYLVIMRRLERVKSKRYKLLSNPERCLEHTRHIAALQEGMGLVRADIAVLKVGITNLEKCSDEIKEDIHDLRNRR